MDVHFWPPFGAARFHQVHHAPWEVAWKFPKGTARREREVGLEPIAERVPRSRSPCYRRRSLDLRNLGSSGIASSGQRHAGSESE